MTLELLSLDPLPGNLAAQAYTLVAVPNADPAQLPGRYKAALSSLGGGSGGGLNFRGAWAANTAYAAQDAVSYGGSLYVALVGLTSGSSFNGSNWTLAVAQGATGATGASGTGGSAAFGTPQVMTATGTIDVTKALVVLNSSSAAIVATLPNGTADGQEIQIAIPAGTQAHTVAGAINEASATLRANSPNVGVTLNLRWSANRTSWYPRSFDGGFNIAQLAAASTVAGGDLVALRQTDNIDRKGTLDALAEYIRTPVAPATLSDASGTITVDLTASPLPRVYDCALSGTGRMLAITGTPVSGKTIFRLRLTGSGTITTYPTGTKWRGASPPTLTGRDEIVFERVGGEWWASAGTFG